MSFAEEFRVQVKTPLGNRGISTEKETPSANRGISTEKETPSVNRKNI